MSERHINDPQSTPPAPASVAASARDVASARRRKFIKAGAGVIPVALTLSSRPVLATTQGKCFSASAWGSIQSLVNTTASQYVRKADKAPTVTCYTRSEWCSTMGNNSTCNGWKANSISCKDLRLNTVQQYTVGKACGNTSTRTAGMSPSVSCWTVLNSSSGYSSAQKAVLVAWLNYRISGTTNTDVCVIDTFSTNQLNTLSSIVANNGGRGPDGKMWTPSDVQHYLHNNFIGRLS
jgi:hypothetical protein